MSAILQSASAESILSAGTSLSPQANASDTRPLTRLPLRSFPAYTPSRIERTRRRTRSSPRPSHGTRTSSPISLHRTTRWFSTGFNFPGRDPFVASSDPTSPTEEHRTERDAATSSSEHLRNRSPNLPLPSLTPSPLPKAQIGTDDHIRSRIETKLTKDQAQDKKPGYLYILQDPQRPGIFKIGFSKVVSERHMKLEKDCGLVLDVLHRSLPIFAEARAEKLCHDELKIFNRPHLCTKCVSANGIPKLHQEWFEVDFVLARKIVLKWTKFMTQRPYAIDGSLNGFWLDRLCRENQNLTEEDMSRSPEDCAVTRHELWQAFVLDRWWHKPPYFLRTAREAIRCFEFWKRVALFLFLLNLFVFLIEVSFGVRMHKFQVLVQIVQLLPYFLIRPLEKTLSTPRRSSNGATSRRSSRPQSL